MLRLLVIPPQFFGLAVVSFVEGVNIGTSPLPSFLLQLPPPSLPEPDLLLLLDAPLLLLPLLLLALEEFESLVDLIDDVPM